MPASANFIEGSNISLGHLGIVADAFDTLGIAAVIDRAIPKTRQHHLTHGEVVKAMVLNGPGFVERRLYLYPEFFSDIAVDRLHSGAKWTEYWFHSRVYRNINLTFSKYQKLFVYLSETYTV